MQHLEFEIDPTCEKKRLDVYLTEAQAEVSRNFVKKLIEEVTELVDSLSTGQSPIDDIGDIIVVLINIAERHKLSIDECLEHAYNDIKDRKGQMIDGIFVKEG